MLGTRSSESSSDRAGFLRSCSRQTNLKTNFWSNVGNLSKKAIPHQFGSVLYSISVMLPKQLKRMRATANDFA